MLSWLRRLAVPVAAIALVLWASASRADTVTFSTQAYFTSGNPNSVVLSGGETLTISGMASQTKTIYSDGSPTSTTFAKFALSDVNDIVSKFSGIQFKIDVYQEGTTPNDPSVIYPVMGTFVGSASGHLEYDANDDSLRAFFDEPTSFALPAPGVVFPPGVSYHVDNDPTSGQSLAFGRDGSANVRGTVAEVISSPSAAQAVPLPGAAMAGLSLLGGFGGFKVLRRRRLQTAA